MNRLLIIPTLILLNSFVSASDDIESVNLQKKLLESTLKIELELEAETVGSGSGIIVKNSFNDEKQLYECVIITCDHVFKLLHDEVSFVKFERNNRGEIIKEDKIRLTNETIKSYYIVSDPMLDIAIIKLFLNTNFFINIEPVPLINNENIETDIKIHTEVFVTGCPFGLDPIILESKIIQINAKRISGIDIPFDVHLIDAPIGAGNSGGGVFNKKGQLIGYIVLSMRETYGGFFPIEHIRDLLNTVLAI